MATHDPAVAPRNRDSGYKGDAWSVSLPPEGKATMLLLDTGLDSVAITQIPNDAWDRGTHPEQVHAHPGYDEAVLIPSGSGTVLHGPDAAHITRSPFTGPVVVQFPAGSWHHIVLDPGARAVGTCFYTVPGTVIEPFAVQMAIVTRGRATFADLKVANPKPVLGTEWRQPLTPGAGALTAGAGTAGADVPGVARILPYPAPRDGLTLNLDTGHDSLFIMAAPPRPEPAEPGPPVMLPLPEFVDVHRHPDVDEYIIRARGAGYILNGPEPETITLTPFRGPCVLVMPAGAFHRIVQTEDGDGGESILIYADRRAVVERYEVIMARTSVATIATAGAGAASQVVGA